MNNKPLIANALDEYKRIGAKGGEYWMGRDIQIALRYSKWEDVAKLVERAKMACESTGVNVGDHFRATQKMITIGKGAQRRSADYFLSRYACYLIAMNGDPVKQEIAVAQTYFAVQTRKQEIQDQQNQLSKRAELRQRVTVALKALNSAAKNAGVQNYAMFHDAGYRGLYRMGLSEIKKHKGISGDLLDHAGRAELAANEFRITQTEEKLILGKINEERLAIATHKNVGEVVRATIEKIGGTMPENLLKEPSLKKLIVEEKKARRLEQSTE